MQTKRMAAGRRFGALVTILALVGLAGCGLFDIRDPEPPPDTSGCARHSPSTVDSVVFNFEASLGCKALGRSNLGEALGTPFQFVLDPLDVTGGGQRPDSMTKSVTLNAFDSFLQSTVKEDSLLVRIHYEELPPDRNQELPDGRHWFDRVGYELLIFAPGETTPKSTLAGIATIYFRTAAGTWTFDRWEDRARDGSTSSLGSVLGDAVGR